MICLLFPTELASQSDPQLPVRERRITEILEKVVPLGETSRHTQKHTHFRTKEITIKVGKLFKKEVKPA